MKILTLWIVLLLLCGGFCACQSKSTQTPLSSNTPWKEIYSQEEAIQVGQRLYESAGANTCLYCHGPQGKGGNIAQAIPLDQIKGYRFYQALGGQKALQANPKEFQKQLYFLHEELIRLGANAWMQALDTQTTPHPTYQNISLNLSKNSGYWIHPLMYGIQMGATLSQIQKVRKQLQDERGIILTEEDMHRLATHNIYLYVRSLYQESLDKEIQGLASGP